MILAADLTIKEVSEPGSQRCASGHEASGMSYQNKSVRWFRVSSVKNPKVNGIYCEPCLIIANALVIAHKR